MAEQQQLDSKLSDQPTTDHENGDYLQPEIISTPTSQVEETHVTPNPSVVSPPPPPPPTTEPLHCPRCNSKNTKFCYYNNYSSLQPRHYCKTCKRYWTKGGVIRNVPIGGRSRKPKLPRLNSSSSVSFSTVRGMTIPTNFPPPSLSLSPAQPDHQFQLHQQYWFMNNANAGGILGGNDGSGYMRGLQLPPIPMIHPYANHGNLHHQMSSMGPNHEHLINYHPTTVVEEGSFPVQVPAPFMMAGGRNASGFLESSMMMGGFGSSSAINSDTIPYNWPPINADVNQISSSAMTSPTFSTTTAAATRVGESEESNG